MESLRFRKLIFTFSLLAFEQIFLAGCERKVDDSGWQRFGTPATNMMVDVVRPKSADREKLDRARELIDLEDERRALPLLRELLNSPDRSVRSDVVDLLSWVGKRALPELLVLMRDRDEIVSEGALRGYEFAIDEIPSDYGKIVAITNAVVHLEKPAFIEALFLKLDFVDQHRAVAALDDLIARGSDGVYLPSAKSCYEHIAGEPWLSSNRSRGIYYKKEVLNVKH